MPDIEPRCSYRIETGTVHKLMVKEYGSEDVIRLFFYTAAPVAVVAVACATCSIWRNFASLLPTSAVPVTAHPKAV